VRSSGNRRCSSVSLSRTPASVVIALAPARSVDGDRRRRAAGLWNGFRLVENSRRPAPRATSAEAQHRIRPDWLRTTMFSKSGTVEGDPWSGRLSCSGGHKRSAAPRCADRRLEFCAWMAAMIGAGWSGLGRQPVGRTHVAWRSLGPPSDAIRRRSGGACPDEAGLMVT